ncbi:carbohydrate ABC transporter permease [Zhihengliuella halotolerans]|uniref:carbohydrate ABC transporter permease n=1 Tax=Zhihengliuella halotolerans TaxID=370736 RepID=UPI000C7F9218|nr:sugar ABC transporter permease [Zhihengliuella halotolerans]
MTKVTGVATRRRPGARDHRVSKRARGDGRAGIGLVFPSVLIVGVLVLAPILWTIALSFQDLRLIDLRRAGIFGDYSLDNFVTVFGSPGFWQALGTTLTYSIAGTAGAIFFGIVTALALRRPFRGRGLVRAAILLPFVAPIVAVTFVWKTMLNPQYGVINVWGTELGWERPVDFLTQRSQSVPIFGVEVDVPIALLTVIFFEIWRTFPFAFLFMTARLEAVPGELDEAATVDGATPTQRFWYVLFPQLVSTIAVITVLRFIWTFNNFDDVYLLTGGAAGTEVVSVRVFNFLIGRGDIGAASAQALVLAAILAVLVIVYLRFVNGKEKS